MITHEDEKQQIRRVSTEREKENDRAKKGNQLLQQVEEEDGVIAEETSE